MVELPFLQKLLLTLSIGIDSPWACQTYSTDNTCERDLGLIIDGMIIDIVIAQMQTSMHYNQLKDIQYTIRAKARITPQTETLAAQQKQNNMLIM